MLTATARDLRASLLSTTQRERPSFLARSRTTFLEGFDSKTAASDGAYHANAVG
jgi:hypothetical protein